MINQAPQPSILITDDDEYNQTQLIGLLKKKLPDADIVTAFDGQSALELIKQKIQATSHTFDLIFMDFQMPGINGEITTHMVRELEQAHALTRPSVIITWSSAKTAAYPGADDWMPKPATMPELERVLTVYGFQS